MFLNVTVNWDFMISSFFVIIKKVMQMHKILIIEDEVKIREELSNFLKNNGYEVLSYYQYYLKYYINYHKMFSSDKIHKKT